MCEGDLLLQYLEPEVAFSVAKVWAGTYLVISGTYYVGYPNVATFLNLVLHAPFSHCHRNGLFLLHEVWRVLGAYKSVWNEHRVKGGQMLCIFYRHANITYTSLLWLLVLIHGCGTMFQSAAPPTYSQWMYTTVISRSQMCPGALKRYKHTHITVWPPWWVLVIPVPV